MVPNFVRLVEQRAVLSTGETAVLRPLPGSGLTGVCTVGVALRAQSTANGYDPVGVRCGGRNKSARSESLPLYLEKVQEWELEGGFARG